VQDARKNYMKISCSVRAENSLSSIVAILGVLHAVKNNALRGGHGQSVCLSGLLSAPIQSDKFF
jgi:hypothetical protein